MATGAIIVIASNKVVAKGVQNILASKDVNRYLCFDNISIFLILAISIIGFFKVSIFDKYRDIVILLSSSFFLFRQ